MILGIDPGLAITGFCVLENESKPKIIDIGTIITPAGESLASRINTIGMEIKFLLSKYIINECSIEQIIFNTNKTTGINVAHCRGVILYELSKKPIKIFEYSPPQIKKAITGSGRAGKADVTEMVKKLLGLKSLIKPDDAADAAAIALCHSHSMRLDV